MKLTYSEQRYKRLKRILTEHVGANAAEFLVRATAAAEKDIKETFGKQLDPGRPIILVGPGRSGDVPGHTLMAVLGDTHKFYRIPIVRIPFSPRSVDPAVRTDVGLAMINRQLLEEIKRAKERGAQLVYVDAVRNKGETQKAYEEIAKRLGIEFDAVINLNEAPRHRIRILGKHLDNYSKFMRLFDKIPAEIDPNGRKYKVNIYRVVREGHK